MARLVLLVALAAATVLSASADYLDLLDRKIGTLFDEGNGNGGLTLEKNDLEALAVKSIDENKAKNPDWTNDWVDKTKAKYIAIWNLINDNNEGGADITKQTVFPAVFKSIGGNDLDQSIDGFYIPVYALFDIDDNGQVTEGEFQRFFSAFGLDPSYSSSSFGNIDNDADTIMSQTELLDALKKWYKDDNPNYADVPFVVAVNLPAGLEV